MSQAAARPRLTPGRLLYLGWHAPLGRARKALREGPLNLWLAARGEQAMYAAAETLPPCPAPAADAPEVTFLSGARFWRQTVFCAASLTLAAGRAYRFVIVDDGTLAPGDAAHLARLLPGVRIQGPQETLARLDAHLPQARYPVLRRHRLAYPHLRKLTDVHAGRRGWGLVLDSDMLFFARPQALMDWLDAPARPLHMVDVADAYGYDPVLLRDIAGAPLPGRVNVGVCGLDSDALDWDRLEAWCARLLAEAGSHYLLEQALTAMLFAGAEVQALPAEAYVVAPARAEARRPTAALHHYVAEAKAWYFRFAWREAARRLGAAP